MHALYPGAPFEWVEFEQGGLGVFVISKQQLDEYFAHKINIIYRICYLNIN